MIKKIPNFKNYFADTDGNIYSIKSGTLKKLKPILDSKKRYLIIKLSNNGIAKNYLVHRLIAITFVPNPNNYNIVHHKDGNTHNPAAINLEWTTQQANIHQSYNTMSQIRNFKRVYLKQNGKIINEFNSISEACRYAQEKFGASPSSLSKYHKHKSLNIEYKNLREDIV